MRPLRYSINVTLDGCCHHEAGLPPDEESMRYWTSVIAQADALLLGRVTYGMMESAWRKPVTGGWPGWMDEWEIPFAETVDRTKKYVVSSTLSGVDWNAELVRGDLSWWSDTSSVQGRLPFATDPHELRRDAFYLGH